MTDSDLLVLLQKVAVWIIPLLFAITLHEVAHGWTAYYFGDRTAKLANRLSLNPLAHVDWIGTVLVPVLLVAATGFAFGWAKPVPIDPRNLKKPSRDMALISLAGPLANGIMALSFALFIRFGVHLHQSGNVLGDPCILIGIAGVQINTVLMVLNLLPFPSLDGGNILVALLPRKWLPYWHAFEPYSVIVLVLLLLSGVLSFVMDPFINSLFHWFSMIAKHSLYLSFE